MAVWRSEQREFSLNETQFSKRQLRPDELGFDPNNILLPEERIKNEFATLSYISKETTLPVPEVLSFRNEDGSWILRTKKVEGVLLEDIEHPEKRAAALKEVDRQMYDDILPQLRTLKRSTVGSVDEKIPVYPPNPVLYKDMRCNWPRIESKNEDYVFCHNDLSGHNIMVDPQTYKITGVIDWEYSGFFPAWFERNLWQSKFRERNAEEEGAYVSRVEEFFDVGKL